MTHSPTEGQKRRTFFKACMAGIGGLISLAMGVPLIGFAISPALQESIKEMGRSRYRRSTHGEPLQKD